MIPSGRFVLLLIVPVVLGLATIGDRSLLVPMLAADAGILAVAVVDALFARRPLVSVVRESAEVFSIGRPNSVTLHLRSSARRSLSVAVRDDLFPGASTDDFPLEVKLRPRSRATLTYSVEPRRRGAYALGAHTVRYSSPLGFWRRQVRIEASTPVKVYPDLQQIRTYELLARQDREYALVRAVRLKGGESEFERLRDYTRDDEFRSIDWKATARRDRLIAREYQLESNQNVFFMLDAGRLMTAEVGQLSYFDHALNATLMLSHVAVRAGDRVGFLGFDDAVRRFVPPGSGPAGAQALIRAGYDLHPRLVEPDYDAAFEQVALRVRKRCLVVMFTQIIDDAVAETVVRRARALMRRHLPLLVLFRDTDVERMVEQPGPGSTGLYHAAAAAEQIRWRDNVLRDLRRAGAHVLDVAAADLTGGLISRYLEIKARHLL